MCRRVLLVLLLAASTASWTARARWQAPTRRHASAAAPAFTVVMCDGDGDDGVAGDSDGDSDGGGDSDGVGVGDDRSLQASLRRAAAAKLGASVDSMMPSDDLAWSSAGSSKMAQALQEGRCAIARCTRKSYALHTLCTCRHTPSTPQARLVHCTHTAYVQHALCCRKAGAHTPWYTCTRSAHAQQTLSRRTEALQEGRCTFVYTLRYALYMHLSMAEALQEGRRSADPQQEHGTHTLHVHCIHSIHTACTQHIHSICMHTLSTHLSMSY